MAGGRGGRGGRNPRDMPREQQVSRKVSWLLRHGAGSEGLKLGKGGYVNVQDALNTHCLRKLNVTFPELRAVVASNDKQRFSMLPVSALSNDESSLPTPSSDAAVSPSAPLDAIPEQDFASENPADYLIRANQGHSIKVDEEGLLTPITLDAANVPDICVHGTDEHAWNLILKGGGLRRMTRNHIHFASGLPAGFASSSSSGAEAPVISGMRKSSTVLIYVDVKKALEKGIKFWKSENGVILTDGDEQGALGYEFFEKVESRKGGGVLMEGGRLPEGVEVDIEAWEKEVGSKGKRVGRGGGRGGRGGRGGGRGGKDGRRKEGDGGEGADAAAEA